MFSQPSQANPVDANVVNLAHLFKGNPQGARKTSKCMKPYSLRKTGAALARSADAVPR